MNSKIEVPEHLIPEELMWLAIQFVLNELPAEEAAAFELRLDHDELACLAVSRATQLSLAMQITCEEFHANSGIQESALSDSALSESALSESGSARSQAPSESCATGQETVTQREVLAERLRTQVAADREKAAARQKQVRKISTLLACGIVCAAFIASLQQSGWLSRSSAFFSNSSVVSNRSSMASSADSDDSAGLLGIYADGNLATGSETEFATDSNALPDPTILLEPAVGAEAFLNAPSEIDVPDWLFTAIELENNAQTPRGDGESSDPSVDSPQDEVPESEVL